MYVNVVKTLSSPSPARGKYEIKGLPPGDYTMAFVQEKLGEKTQKVTLAAKDTKTVDQGFTPCTLPECSAAVPAAVGGGLSPRRRGQMPGTAGRMPALHNPLGAASERRFLTL